MNDIFSKDLSGEIVSPNEPGYDVLIDDIFRTMETAQELATHDIAGCKNRLWSHRGRRQRGDERCSGHDCRGRQSGKNHQNNRKINKLWKSKKESAAAVF